MKSQEEQEMMHTFHTGLMGHWKLVDIAETQYSIGTIASLISIIKIYNQMKINLAKVTESDHETLR